MNKKSQTNIAWDFAFFKGYRSNDVQNVHLFFLLLIF